MNATSSLSEFMKHRYLPSLGLLAFAVAAGCALYCCYLNSRCLKLQIDILRLLGRMNAERWSDNEELRVNGYFLEKNRKHQRFMLRLGKQLIFVSVIAIIVGAGATVAGFVLALFPGT